MFGVNFIKMDSFIQTLEPLTFTNLIKTFFSSQGTPERSFPTKLKLILYYTLSIQYYGICEEVKSEILVWRDKTTTSFSPRFSPPRIYYRLHNIRLRVAGVWIGILSYTTTNEIPPGSISQTQFKLYLFIRERCLSVRISTVLVMKSSLLLVRCKRGRVSPNLAIWYKILIFLSKWFNLKFIKKVVGDL